mmetsp:Transcript_21211/g.48578  ORF Transcript_21211/g.48578 Transcript_21211/m.48578 type:complete len:218 (-) Transcript_21211:7-660(-)
MCCSRVRGRPHSLCGRAALQLHFCQKPAQRRLVWRRFVPHDARRVSCGLWRRFLSPLLICRPSRGRVHRQHRLPRLRAACRTAGCPPLDLPLDLLVAPLLGGFRRGAQLRVCLEQMLLDAADALERVHELRLQLAEQRRVRFEARGEPRVLRGGIAVEVRQLLAGRPQRSEGRRLQAHKLCYVVLRDTAGDGGGERLGGRACGAGARGVPRQRRVAR